MKTANEEYPQLILDCAKQIAFEKGLNEINVREVAKLANVSVGTIYNYYTTKDDLIIGVLTDFWRNAFKAIHLECGEDQKDFFVRIEKLYLDFYGYMAQFKENFLSQVASFNKSVLKESKVAESEAFLNVERMIMILMDEDVKLAKYAFNDGFTKPELAHILFQLMLIMLKEKAPTFTHVSAMFRKNFN